LNFVCPKINEREERVKGNKDKSRLTNKNKQVLDGEDGCRQL
jgi:hypothetical protein